MVEPIVQKSINTIRGLSADIVQKANSGHPGMPLGCAPMAYDLFKNVMRYNPKNPSWFNRDRFVLSNGHGCALLYSMLHLTGFDNPTMEDLKSFRQINSLCAGHPENHLLKGVEVSTGPLGQGIANGVGMAIAERHLAAEFNKKDFEVIDSFTFVMCGDGCLQEGVSAEASSLAGHLELGKLIVLYDDNDIQIDGSTNLAFSENVKKRYESYGWQVLEVADGNSDFESLSAAISEAKATKNKPTMIKVKTAIGFGSSKAGSEKAHGSPLGDEVIKKMKEAFGLNPEANFAVDEDVAAHLSTIEKGAELEKKWNELFSKYEQSFEKEAAELKRRISGKLPADWEKNLPSFTPADKGDATRNSSGEILNVLAEKIPEIMGGSADLTPSNKTWLNCSKDFQPGEYDGRYLRFGVREHGMAAICNGIAAFGGVVPYCATFLNFAGYAAGAMRLSALSEFRVIYIMTHDSIGLGEDGPTHQPIETLAMFRAMPNFYVFRPADANEVVGSYTQALLMEKSPSLLSLTRQGLPNLAGSSAADVAKGAYQVVKESAPSLILAATGSEVSIMVDTATELAKEGVKAAVVSMPCFKLFEKQEESYKESVFPKNVPVLAMEAAASFGWHRYADKVIAMETFGASGKYQDLYKHFGMTKENALLKAKELLATKK